MMKNLNPTIFLAALAVCFLGSIFYIVYDIDSKNRFIVIQGNNSYKTREIDSISNGSIYFRNNHGSKVTVTGNYTLITINRN